MKKILGIIVAICLFLGFTGCNYQTIDTTYKYDRAIIALQTGEVIDVEVKKWADYDGEQLQIIAEDGTVYLTSSFNCTLIRDK